MVIQRISTCSNESTCVRISSFDQQIRRSLFAVACRYQHQCSWRSSNQSEQIQFRLDSRRKQKQGLSKACSFLRPTRFGDAEMKFCIGKVHHVNDSSFYEVSRESPVLFQISISVRFRTIRDRADGKESF
ncbi:hypothetical protein M5689_000628 [Euphorbia peplus]|nr:hypothetical protein M5689_000628 [Euphorbia peplus]